MKRSVCTFGNGKKDGDSFFFYSKIFLRRDLWIGYKQQTRSSSSLGVVTPNIMEAMKTQGLPYLVIN